MTAVKAIGRDVNFFVPISYESGKNFYKVQIILDMDKISKLLIKT